MNTFKKIVGAPFRAVGWVAGQIKNGYEAATKAVTPVVAKAAETLETAKKTVVKAGTATAAFVAKAARAVGRAAYTIVYTVRQVILLAALGVLVSLALVGLAVTALAAAVSLAAAWVGGKVAAGFQSVVAFLRGPRGLDVAAGFHFAALMAAMIAAVYAIVVVVALIAPLAIPLAEIVVVAKVVAGAAITAAALSVAGTIVESSNETARVYYGPTRRVIPNNPVVERVVDGVVHG